MAPTAPPGRAHHPLGLHMAMDRVGPNPLTLLEREQGDTGWADAGGGKGAMEKAV